jgi:hypothetical protein
MVSRRQQDRALERARAAEQHAEDEVEMHDEAETHDRADEFAIIEAARQGEKRQTLSILKHTVEMKVLNAREEMEAFTLVSQYENSLAYPLAYNTAIFAMSVIRIDGEPFIPSISKRDDTPEARYEKAKDYYSKFIEKYCLAYRDMKNESDKELEALGK